MSRPENAESCPLCGSSPADPCVVSTPDRLRGTAEVFCVALCSACGCGWTLPPASEDELASFYPDSYGAYRLEVGFLGRVQQAGLRVLLDDALRRPPLRSISRLPPGRLLDVGCGRGDLAGAFVRHGWRVVGVDLSPSACELARARGVETRVGTLGTVALEDEAFDAVVMTHSLEHVVDPRLELARIHRLLRPEGLLMISVPNFGSWQRYRFGADWFPLELPRHRTHFTTGSLGLVLEREGFELVSVFTGSDNGFALLATLQYAHAGRLVITRGPAVWASYAVWPINLLIDRLRGPGALLHAVARRPAAGRAPDSTPRPAP